MPNISEQSLEFMVFIINGCKLLTFKEPIKVVHLQILVNQLRLSSTLVVEIINNSFCESSKKYWSRDKARNILIEKSNMGSEKYLKPKFKRCIKEQQSCLYLDQ